MKTLPIISIIFILVSSGCSHYYYAPNEGAALALNEKSDLKFSAATTGISGYSFENNPASYLSNYSLLLGYSPIKHLGIQSSLFNKSNINAGSDGYVANFAIGGYYFHPSKEIVSDKPERLVRRAMNRGFCFDFYVGYGRGAVDNYYDNPIGNSSSHFNFNKTFAQAGVHWQGKLIGIDYTFRVSNLDYDTGRFVQFPNLNVAEMTALDNILRLDPFLLRENTIKIHLGGKYVRFFISTTFLYYSKSEVNFKPNTFFLGGVIEFDEFFKKEETINKQLE